MHLGKGPGGPSELHSKGKVHPGHRENVSRSPSEILNRIGVPHGTPKEMKAKAPTEDSPC